MFNPKVSIIIPVYNGADYVAEAIESALAQTYRNTEVVVVNDGSTDSSATDRAVEPYLKHIKYIKKENGGVSTALNRGIKEMSGEYFSWLSHDDLYSPEKIEKQVSLIKGENDIILCSGDLFDENRQPIRHYIKTLNGRFNGRELYAHNISGYNLNGLGFLIPKHVFEKIGGFDISMRYLQDYDMWLRIMMDKSYSFVCHKDILVHTRIHRGQQTNTISNVFDIDREKMAIKHIDLIKNDKTIEDKDVLFELYYKAFVQGKNNAGIELADQALTECGYSSMKKIIIKVRYGAIGKLKSFSRMIINSIRKIKGARN